MSRPFRSFLTRNIAAMGGASGGGDPEEDFNSYSAGDIVESALTGGTGWATGNAVIFDRSEPTIAESFNSYAAGSVTLGSDIGNGVGWNGNPRLFEH